MHASSYSPSNPERMLELCASGVYADPSQEDWDMKSKKRAAKQQAAPATAPHPTYRSLPDGAKFTLEKDAEGLNLGILTKGLWRGYGGFVGNARTPLGGAIYVGAAIRIDPA